MIFTDLFFGFIALAIVATGAGVLLTRNAIYTALFLVANFSLVAVLYLVLGAPFLAMAQVTVYAGAIMVLFLFVIMLLDLKEEEQRKFKTLTVTSGVVVVGLILAVFLQSLLPRNSALNPEATPTFEGGTIELGKLLFRQYVLPFEIVSVLLLVAMVGVVLLSKKDLK